MQLHEELQCFNNENPYSNHIIIIPIIIILYMMVQLMAPIILGFKFIIKLK